MAKHLIDIIGVSKQFGKDRILEDINFSVEKGKTIALVGHNGCGKSTLLRMIALLTTVSEGKIIHHKKWKMTYIPERFPKSDFTAREYVVNMGMLEGLSKEEAKERGRELLKTFFMDSMADKPMKYLSKGTLQKTAVIQALLTKADILLMDEPLSGQDVESQNIFMGMIQNYVKGGGSVVMSCHEKKLINRLADIVYEIKDGHLKRAVLEDTFLQEYNVLIFESEPGGGVLPKEVEEAADMVEKNSFHVKIRSSSENSNPIIKMMLNAGYELREMQNVQE